MNIITDNIGALSDIYKYFISKSPIILTIIILILLAIIILGYRYYTKLIADRDQTNNQIAMEIFNIKQGTNNSAALTLYPKVITSTLNNFNSKYECHFIINPYTSFGDHFAIKISSKSEIKIELLSGQVVPTQFIGGYYSIHLNDDSFNCSLNNYYSIIFLMYVKSNPIEFKIEIINENVTGTYKFLLNN